MSSLSLNSQEILKNRIDNEISKFTKAIEQVKILEKRLVEMLDMFDFYNKKNVYLTSEDNNGTEAEIAQEKTINANHNLIIQESLRQQIESTEGVINAYTQYSKFKETEIATLQVHLYGEEALNTTARSPRSIRAHNERLSNQYNRNNNNNNDIDDNTLDNYNQIWNNNSNNNNDWNHFHNQQQQQHEQNEFLTAQ
jgi:hypothetical protein